MKSKLFKRITASALALLMVCASVPSGSDFSQFFTGSKIIASAQNEVSVKHANEYGKEEDIVLDPENFDDSSSYCYVDRSLQYPAINISGRGLYDGIINYLGIPFKVYDEDGGEVALTKPYEDDVPNFYTFTKEAGKKYYAVRDYVEANKDNWDENAEPIEQTEFYTVQHIKDQSIQDIELKPDNFTKVCDQVYSDIYDAGLIVDVGYGCIDKPTLTGFINTMTSDFAVYNGFTGERVAVNRFDEKQTYYSFAIEQGVDYYVVNGDLNKCGDSAWYELVDTDDNNIPDKLVIGGKGEMWDYDSDSDVPWHENADNIITVEIADGITRIGDHVFDSCTSIGSVTIPDSVTAIGDFAFYSSELIEDVALPGKLTSIGEGAFAYCTSLKNISIPKSVTTIGNMAFSFCSTLENLSFADESELETIGEYAFSGCALIESVTIPAGVTSIGEDAFFGCTGCTDVYCLVADPTKLEWTDGGFDDFIYDEDDPDTHKVTKCHVPMEYLDSYKTKYATGEDTDINVTFVGGGKCGDNAWWDFDSESGKLTINGTGDMYDYEKLSYVPWHSLRDENKIAAIEIAEGITKIGTRNFSDFKNKLKNVNIPASVKEIGDLAFYYSMGITTVTFAEGSKLETIGSYAFSTLTSLAQITIPESIRKIGLGAFKQDFTLSSVYLSTDPTLLTWNIDSDDPEFMADKNTTCYVPGRYLAAYREKFTQNADEDKNLNATLACKNQCGENAWWEFDSESGKLTINGTGDMWDYKFNYTYNVPGTPWYDYKDDIKTVEISEGITTVGIMAFYSLTELTSVSIPSTVKKINGYAFTYCASLSSLTFATESKLEFIGDHSFLSVDLTDIVLPEGVTTIEYSAFGNSSSIKSVTLPSTISSINVNAFAHCSNLDNIYIYSDPSKLTWNADQYESGNFKPNKGTKCHVPKEYYATYIEKYANGEDTDINVTFVVDDCKVTVAKSTGGKVTADKTSVTSGDTVNLTVKPNTGYKLKSLTVKDSNDKVVTVTDNAFVMPVDNVTVTAVFEKKKFTVKFVNDDGTVLQTESLEYGAMPEYKGETPTKAKTAQYTYTFNGWNKEIVAVTKAVAYTATYTSTVNKYTVKFVNDDGTVLQTESLEYGAMPEYKGETPTKAKTAQYTYTFNGWNKDIVAVTKAVTYTATYTSTVNKYTVKFVNDDGTVLQTESLEYGAMPVYKGETPTKAKTAQYTYTFNGWNKEIVAVTKAATYKATFTSEINKYTVRFVNDDGTVLQTETLAYGTMPEYKGETPTKAKTAQYTYTFNGWNKDIVAVTKAVTYKATFTSEINKYTVKFVNDDGTVLQTESLEYGAMPVYKGETPTKAKTAQYTYTFNGWNKDIVAVTKAVTYTATYTSTVNKYTVKFVNDDGTVLQTETLAYGAMPEYKGETPTKAKTAQYTYTFNGWNKEIVAVTKAATYKATYTSTVNKYTVRFVNDDGTVLQTESLEYGAMPVYKGETPTKAKTAQYTYTFNGWNKDIVAVTKAATYKATFTSEINKYTLTLPKNFSVGGTAASSYDYSTVVKFKVNSGYVVIGDVKNGSTVMTASSGVYSVKITKDTTITAITGVKVAAKKATCTVDGNTLYYKGSDGNYYKDTKGTKITLAETVIPATGHSYGEPEWTWNGTKSATAKFTCANDNSHVENFKATITSETTKATCEKDGKTVYTATVEFGGKTYTDTKTVVIEKTGHAYGEPAWTWNGTKSATAKFTCANDKSHVENFKATITSETTKATCEKDGKTVYTATVEFGGKTYTDTKTVVIPAKGHKYGAPVWTWTGTTVATAKFTCANDKSHIENFKATITSETTKATCTADGKTVYTATVEFNGKTYTDTKTVVIEKTGHAYGEPEWTWNGTKSASAKFTCANDKSHVENVKATITSESTKATCEKDGKTVYTATVEFGGKTYTDTKTVVIEKTGHNYGEPEWTWNGTKSASAKFTCANDKSHVENFKATITSETTKATCTADGKTVYTATVEFGGKTYTDTKTVVIEKTGHKYGAPVWTWTGTTKATAKFTCANDNSHVETAKATITSETTKATCEKDRKTVYTATVEFGGKTYTDTKTVVIEKTGHKFGEWKTIGFSVSKGTATQKRKCSVCGKSESRTVENALKRISGDGRYATAAAISKETFKKADTVVLAYGLNYTDALAGVPLANMYKAPILLTGTDSLPKETLAEIKRLGAKKVIILGGTGAIGKKVVDKLKANGLKTERISGTSRFGTAAAIAKKMTKSPAEIFFVYAYNYADALSASAVAAAKNAPIIYLKKNGKLDDDTAKYLASVKGKVKNAYVIGGKGVIEDDIMADAAKALGLKVGSTVVRVAGSNRFETCVAVNKKFKSVLTGNGICIATGFDFPDALAGGVLAAQKKIPMFLANGKLSESQTKYLASRKIDFITVLGGQGAVPDSLVREIAKASV